MIRGSKVALRPPSEGDMETLLALRNDVELQARLIAIARGSTMEQVREWLRRRTGDEHGLFFVIADATDDRCLGYVQLTGIDPVHGFAELGLCVDPAAHRRGYGAEALSLLERHAAGALGLRKIMLRVLVSNGGAVSFYEALGYRRVGIHERHVLLLGRLQDVLLMEKFLTHE